MKFGKYADLTVNSLLNLKKTRYLRWVYFNCSMITFTDDILEEIKIPKDFIIEKPGKNPEKHEELNKIHDVNIHGLTKYILNAKNKKAKKGAEIGRLKREQIYFSKSSMARYNRGHR